MLDWWFEISWWVRGFLACTLLTYGVWSCFAGYHAYEHLQAETKRTNKPERPFADRRARGQFQMGILATGVGLAFLAVSGRSPAEKNGYRSV